MQQQKNSNLQYSPEALLERDRQIIQIEDTPAFRRNKQRAEVEAKQLEMRSILTSVIGDHDIGAKLGQGEHSKDPSLGYLSKVDRVSTGNIDLVKIRWHGAFWLEQNPSTTHYLIYLVLAGSLAQKIGDPSIQSQSYATAPLAVDNQTRELGDQIWRCTPESATTIDLGQKLVSSSSEQGEVLLISINRDQIDSALSKLIDRTSKQPIKFLPKIDLTNQFGLSLKNFAQFLWQAATKQEHGTEIDSTSRQVDFAPLVLQKLEQAFLACLIEGLPSNYSEEILYQTNGAFARHVHTARTFIESRLHEEIKLGDIATATGVCPRLLQKAFSAHCGCSPMRFVILARLHQVRQELTQASTNTKIVDVMMQYQFTQGGKFAKEYHQLFGEKPSETLKKSSQFDRAKAQLWHQLDDTTADRIGGGLVSTQQISFIRPTSVGVLAGLRHLFASKVCQS